jgi:Cu(I)/Ag(I) efflux system membrane fusion protein
MNVRLRFVALMVIIGLVAGNWENIMNHYDRWRRPAGSDMVASTNIEYYCPMHPSIITANPGNCPLCGMPLSKRKKGEQQALPQGVLAQVSLSPQKVEMGRIGTSPVEYRLLSWETRSVGIVDYDETRRSTISARIKGRLDKLLVNYVGQRVKKGDPLARIYSPELLVAQEELLTAAHEVKKQKEPGGLILQASQGILDATRKKLLLWGLTDSQVDDILEQGTPQTHVTIFSPIAGIVTEKKKLEGQYVMEGDEIFTVADLGGVWLQAKIFESDIKGIGEGTAVEVISTAYPNEIFAGRITFVAYLVDPATRTISARVEVANPELKLKPGMYVTATIRLPVGKVEEIAATTQPTSQPSQPAQHVPTESVARAYLKLVDVLASDRTEPTAVETLAKEAETIAARLPVAAQVAKQVHEMEGKDLAAQRDALKSLSPLVIKLLEQSPPAGMQLHIARCPMEKGGDWILTSGKKDETFRNPYYGSEMLTCGDIVGPLQASSVTEDRQYAMGYFCPVEPGKLFEKPEHCPIDGFPLKYVRLQKVLAVPESAVIDTGTRKVVYRQAEPGMFHMVEVKLGNRAGNYYPLVSGLNEGDLVATQGAFLVDAENRLNPAASAQYFGASGGPSGSGDHKH